MNPQVSLSSYNWRCALSFCLCLFHRLKARESRRSRNLLTDHLNLLSKLNALSLHPALPILQGQSFLSAAFGIHPDVDGFPLGQLSWQAARVGRQRRGRPIDRWHFTSAGGSTESRGSPKSSWGGTSFSRQGPPHKPPPLFRSNKWGERTKGFREHLSHTILASALIAHFFPPLFNTNWHWRHCSLYVHLFAFLSLSVSSFLFELWVCLLYN